MVVKKHTETLRHVFVSFIDCSIAFDAELIDCLKRNIGNSKTTCSWNWELEKSQKIENRERNIDRT